MINKDTIANEGTIAIFRAGNWELVTPTVPGQLLNLSTGALVNPYPTCRDGKKNQGESRVDCGGPCPACPGTCIDGIQNQDETGIDCGGSYCYTCQDTYDDYLFLTDASGSVGFDNWRVEKDFVSDIIKNQISLQSRVGIIVFSTKTKVKWHLNDSKDRNTIDDAIMNLPYLDGYTSTLDALNEAVNI
jgi:hypothetical protein